MCVQRLKRPTRWGPDSVKNHTLTPEQRKKLLPGEVSALPSWIALARIDFETPYNVGEANQMCLMAPRNFTRLSLTMSEASCWTQWPTLSSSIPPIRPGAASRIRSMVRG
jgi:hypothetical protein